VNPEKLSLLADEELILLADRMGIFIPEGLDRRFIIEEIITALDDDDHERVFSHDGTGHVEEKKFSGSRSLPAVGFEKSGFPERYNETMIRALPRDPAWIYTYWDLSEQKRESLSGDDENFELFLRVVELQPESGHKKDFFDISISHDDWKWYINIPSPGETYRIDLCVRKNGAAKVLARSNEVRMPIFFVRHAQRIPKMTKSLLLLSGIEDLHLFEQKEENPSRILFDNGE